MPAKIISLNNSIKPINSAELGISTEDLPNLDKPIKLTAGKMLGQRKINLLKKDYPDLYNILFDVENATKLLKIASQLRMKFDFDKYRPQGWQDPLEYAVANSLYLHLGADIYITPVTESYRRHTLFVMNAAKQISFALEIKIPGELDDRRNISHKNFEIAEKITGDPATQIVKPLFFEALPKGQYSLYKQTFNYNWNEPLGIMGYEYVQGRRLYNLGEVGLKSLFLSIASSYKNIKKFYDDLAEQAVKIIQNIHQAGFICQNNEGTDLHTENFKIFIENGKARLFFVSDTGAFHEPPLFSPETYFGLDVRNFALSLQVLIPDLDIKKFEEKYKKT
ncbi:MAG: hypothetical protein PHV30_05195 [Candidatus Margulisbacteria bacterium]|nr:hypothetical protein [Candidatus Margulisiibacteriota bacterium]